MEFTKFCAGSTPYGTGEKAEPKQESNVNLSDPDLMKLLADPASNKARYDELSKMLLYQALCHTIVINTRNGSYSASSPDELALVNAAK